MVSVIVTIVWHKPFHILGFLIILELGLGLDMLRHVVSLNSWSIIILDSLVLSLGHRPLWLV